MISRKLRSQIAYILAFGPRRVVVDKHGDAQTPEIALRDHGVRPDVVFVRKDGWALGAPRKYEKVAASMWDYVARIEATEITPKKSKKKASAKTK